VVLMCAVSLVLDDIEGVANSQLESVLLVDHHAASGAPIDGGY
jgi:hypothetical protein